MPIKSNAAFLLATRKGLIVCENILTTSIRTLRLDINREDPPKDYPPSPYKPLWATWTRPRRGSEDQEEDYVYLITEDGKVYYLVLDQDMPAEGVVANYVGNLNCHIDSACAPFGRSDQGDILIVQGVSSDGCVWIVSQRIHMKILHSANHDRANVDKPLRATMNQTEACMASWFPVCLTGPRISI